MHEAERALCQYVRFLKDDNKSPATGRVYLSNLSKLLQVYYKLGDEEDNIRTTPHPLLSCVNDLRQDCYKAVMQKVPDNPTYDYAHGLDIVNFLLEFPYTNHYDNSLQKGLEGNFSTDVLQVIFSTLVLQSLQRPGAVGNMTVREFDKGKTTSVEDESIFSVAVKKQNFQE